MSKPLHRICYPERIHIFTDREYQVPNYFPSESFAEPRVAGDPDSLEPMQSLPSEVNGLIEDMACRKQHNGSPSRFGLIVCTDVDFAKKVDGDFERELEAWIYMKQPGPCASRAGLPGVLEIRQQRALRSVV
jgi:hypothetical protein